MKTRTKEERPKVARLIEEVQVKVSFFVFY